jgi:excinuclease ABC subunit B
VLDIKGYDPDDARAVAGDVPASQEVAEEQAEYRTIPEMEKAVKQARKQMEKAARDLDFIEAARLRDEMFRLQKRLEEMKS